MNRYVILLSISLIGCVTPGQHFKQTEIHCSSNSTATNYGQCMEARLTEKLPNWRNDIHASYATAYFSWLKAAGSRVEKGEMQEDDFWKGSYELLERMKAQAKSEGQAQNQNSMALFLTGLAIMSYGAQPAYTAPNFPAPRQPITCHDLNNGIVRCF